MNRIIGAYNAAVNLICSPKLLFEFFLSLFIVSIPFSRRTLIYGSEFGNSHLFDPFSSVFLYVTDVFIVLTLFFFGLSVYKGLLDLRFIDGRGQRIFWIFILTLFLFYLGSSVFATDVKLIFLSSIRLLLYLFIFYLLSNDYLSLEKIFRLLLFSMLFQSALALYQYFYQHSAGFAFLGEVSYGPNTLGIAKIDYHGEKFVRSYGTFLHPNVLGGFALFSAIFSYYFWKKSRKIKWVIMIVIFASTLILSFSRSAFFGFLFATGIYLVFINPRIRRAISWQRVFWGFIVMIVLALSSSLVDLAAVRMQISSEDKSVSERLNYMDISYAQILSQPQGLGANHFTLTMQDFTPFKLLPWERQPVHNVFLLIAAELGLHSVILVVAFLLWLTYVHYYRNHKFLMSFDKTLNNLLFYFFISALVISLVDHYFITNNSALALLVICLTISIKCLRSGRKVVRKMASFQLPMN